MAFWHQTNGSGGSFFTDFAIVVALSSDCSEMIQLQKRPRHFHLLWDEDLDELREVLKAIRDRRGEVVAAWYELYRLHFGDERSLPEAEFRRIFEAALLRNQDALLRKDMDGYAASVLMTGRQLAELHVPLDELIAAVQLLEEAAQTVFPADPPLTTAVYNKFDKLSHIRIILLVASYSRMQSAAAATRIHALELEARNLPPEERTRFHGLVGQSAVMRELYRQIEAASRHQNPVLILGEPGSGKEMAARAIHECGARPDAPFITMRCAAFPRRLVESELFGYRQQSADGGRTYMGLYGAAAGGTLFVEEISTMPLEVQGKLAQTIEDTRTGEDAGVRIIASTTLNPEEAARTGRMADRLIGTIAQTMRIPPLRERRGDIALLARHFIDLLSQSSMNASAVTSIDDHALELMEPIAWPGNVQQLFEVIEDATAAARSSIIGPADLPAAISGTNGHVRTLPTISFETFADAERAVLQRALEITGGNKLRAAKLLKISRKKLYSGIAKYGLVF
jgi:DNA-binding NtrC family response regulator